MNNFLEYYKTIKKQIDEEIIALNNELLKETNPLLKGNINLLTNLNKDGKRIRGVLVMLGYNLLGDNVSYAKDLAIAYEMFQTAILVHDDIIDNDDKRRGVDTIHFANYNKYKKYDKSAKHLGNSIAICMGDFGLYTANKIISDRYSDDKNLAKILTNFNSTVLTTIKGELIDVILPFQGKNHLIDSLKVEENILEIYRLKTSHYTIIGPLSVGLILSGASKEHLDDIEKFGEKVGIAFQIQDDILGIYSSNMGKVVASDIKEFKQTILYAHIINTPYKEEFLKYYGKDITKNNVEKVRKILKESNSLSYAEDKMNEMYDASLNILHDIKWLSNDKKELLKGFVEYLRSRKK